MEIRKKRSGEERSRRNDRTKMLQKAIISSVVGLMLALGTVSNSILQPAFAANTLTVEGLALDGKPLSMWVVVQSEGSTVKAGFTPLTFSGDEGASYSVIARDYLTGNIFFDHWENGSTNRTITVTLDEDVALTAYYKTPESEAQSFHILTINAFDQNNNELHMYTTIRDDESTTTLKTGFSPMTHEGIAGEIFSVTVSNYGSLTFDRWEDGSTERTRAVTLDSDKSITAHYVDEAANLEEKQSETDPSVEEEEVAANFNLTVNAEDMSGNPKTGMYTTIRDDESTTVMTGFTPVSYVGNAGATYTVTVSNYGSSVFDHWEDGSTERTRTLTLDSDMVVTAHYRVPMLTLSPTSGDGGSTTITTTGYYFSPDSSVTVTYSGQTVAAVNTNSAGSFSTSFLAPSSGQGMHTVHAKDSSGWEASSSFEDTSAPEPLPEDESQKTGVFVALYMYPGSTGSVHWQKVIDEKNEHPSVPIVAAFNPSSGPGSSKDSNIASWVAKLQDAGVTAIGYVADDYGTRSLSALRADTDKYVNWYGADGLFIDEFTNKVGYESHYQQITDYAKSQGMELTMGNPGTDVPPSYIGTVDVINTSEGKGYTSLTDPNLVGSSWVSGGYSGWHKDHPKDNFSIIRYDISSLDTSYVDAVSEWVGLVYITDGNDSNHRWFHVPSYFGELVEALDR